MKILGIDPGTLVMGYGVIDCQEETISPVDFGAITLSADVDISERLSQLYRALTGIIEKHHPDSVAVEQPFVSRNVRSALAIGRAQAVAMLAAANQGIPCFEYTPAQVKQHVTDYGASDKEQVQEMVRLQLGLEEVPRPNDAADALAVAMCHLQETHVRELLSGRGESR